MDLSWLHDYTNRPQLVEAFREESRVAAGIEDSSVKSGEIRALAEAAGRVSGTKCDILLL